MSVKKQFEELYNDISFELTNFENEDTANTETTLQDWIDTFYHLLVRTQNEIECIYDDN